MLYPFVKYALCEKKKIIIIFCDFQPNNFSTSYNLLQWTNVCYSDNT